MKLRFLLLLAMLSGPALFRRSRSSELRAQKVSLPVSWTLRLPRPCGYEPPPAPRLHVHLRTKNRRQVAGMLTKGRESARVLRRASILVQLDRGQKAAQVAASVGVAAKTVRAVARRYEEQGLESALCEKPRPGKQRALDAGQSQRIIAMVCGSPPKGMARWSVRLIASEAVKRKLVPRD